MAEETYGLGEWGLDEWGSPDAGTDDPALVSVTPGIANVAGGTVVALLGTNFTWPMTVELMLAGEVLDIAVIADERYDLKQTRVYVGLPALDIGKYDIRITTDLGVSLLENAIEYRLFAEELKVETTRSKWARAWNLGPRMLTG